MMKNLAILIVTIGLSACGLKPVYGNNTGQSGPIAVEQIDGRIGHRVRQELNRSLTSGLPGVAPGASLRISVEERLTRLPLQLNDGVSRSALVAEATYELYDSTGVKITSGKDSETVSFDTARSSYGDIALQNDARERVGRALAKSLFQQLVLQTNKLENTGESN